MVENDTHGPTSLVEWIESCVATFRDEVCVTGASESLTFAQLWRRALALASHLQNLGVARGDCVGLLVEQNADQLVGLVGIMAAGGVYVPLDPTYPSNRLSQMIRDSRATFVVTPDHLRHVAQSLEARAVSVNVDADTTTTLLARPPLTRQDAAYVIFTSGSTGRPKGVVVEHGALMALLQWMIDDCDVRPGDRVMGTASPNFDASLPNFLLPLVTGATFVALSREALRDPHELSAAIAAARPRFLQASPTMLRMLTEMGWLGDAGVEIWTGGERCASSVITYLVPRVRSFCNYYGPTEATVQVTVARLRADDVDSPIGSPPPQFGCHVLDENGEHVGPLGKGELFISGASLARGYLNDPALTAERFVAIRGEDGSPLRAYRTGDIVRYRDDGALVVVGRADSQVKLRGYRIEPGEIEARLMDLTGVSDAAVVVARGDEDDEARLVAFVVGDAHLAPEMLQRGLARELPDYMIPRTIHVVAAFPVAPSGKVDRKVLTEMAATTLQEWDCHPAEQVDVQGDEIEAFIHRSFASTLQVSESDFDCDADFFELGGTSIRCARLFMLLEDHFDVTLPLSTIVTASSVRQLAHVIRREKGTDTREVTTGSFEWQEIISDMWATLLEVPWFNLSDSFYQLGGDDMLAQQFLDLFNRQHETHLTLEDFHEAPTVAQLGALVSGDAPHESVVVLNAQGDKTPIFCIAGSGGLALAFLELSKVFGPDQPFYGLQAKGLEQRALPEFSLNAASRRYTRLIRKVQPEGPYVIAGHSLGGVIALQVAQRLKRAGQEVALLAIFDSLLAPRMVGLSPGDVRQPLAGNTATLRGIIQLRPNPRNVVRLAFRSVFRPHGAAPFETFCKWGIVQATLCRRLRPWSGRSVLYVSDMSPDEIEGGWRQLLTGSWDTVKLPGDHHAMLRRPTVVDLVADLRARIGASLKEDVLATH